MPMNVSIAQSTAQSIAQSTAQGGEHTTELPADPVVFGVVAFLLLLALLVGLMMFGKGRPHS